MRRGVFAVQPSRCSHLVNVCSSGRKYFNNLFSIALDIVKNFTYSIIEHLICSKGYKNIMSENNKISYDLEIGEGTSKKNGKPWKAFFLTVTPSGENTRPVTFAIFPKSYQWHALGLSSPYDVDKK